MQDGNKNNGKCPDILVSYVNEDAGIYTALASVEILEALTKSKSCFIRHDVDRLKSIY